MEQFQHERNDQHDGGLGLLHVRYNVAQAFALGNGAAAVDGAQEPARAFIGMVQGEDGQKDVVRTDVGHGTHAFQIGADVLVRQHDGLGLGRGAGREQKDAQGIVVDFRVRKARVALLQQGTAPLQKRSERQGIAIAVILHADEMLHSGDFRPYGFGHFLFGPRVDQGSGLRSRHEAAHLRNGQFLVQRNRDADAVHGSQIRHIPLVPRFSQDGDPLSLDAQIRKSGAQCVHVFGKLPKRDGRIRRSRLLLDQERPLCRHTASGSG